MDVYSREHEMGTGPRKTAPWNKGKLVGQKPPLKLPEVWPIRIRLQLNERQRDELNLAIDRRLRAATSLPYAWTVLLSGLVQSRIVVLQRKTD